jgi:hypothetical protein
MLIDVENEYPHYYAVITGTKEALEAAKFRKIKFDPKKIQQRNPAIDV